MLPVLGNTQAEFVGSNLEEILNTIHDYNEELLHLRNLTAYREVEYRTWRSNGYHLYLVFFRSCFSGPGFKCWSGCHIFFDNVRHFTQSLKEKARIIPQNALDIDLDL
jgi:hypothetical protein